MPSPLHALPPAPRPHTFPGTMPKTGERERKRKRGAERKGGAEREGGAEAGLAGLQAAEAALRAHIERCAAAANENDAGEHGDKGTVPRSAEERANAYIERVGRPVRLLRLSAREVFGDASAGMRPTDGVSATVHIGDYMLLVLAAGFDDSVTVVACRKPPPRE